MQTRYEADPPEKWNAAWYEALHADCPVTPRRAGKHFVQSFALWGDSYQHSVELDPVYAASVVKGERHQKDM